MEYNSAKWTFYLFSKHLTLNVSHEQMEVSQNIFIPQLPRQGSFMYFPGEHLFITGNNLAINQTENNKNFKESIRCMKATENK